MDNIDRALLHHFAGSGTPGQEQYVKSFRQNNEERYQRLRTLWYHQKSIELHSFEPSSAWKVFRRGQSLSTSSILWIWVTPMRAAATVAGLIVFSVLLFYYPDRDTDQMTTFSNNSGMAMEKLFEDGTIVWLNSGCTVTWSEDFNVSSRNCTVQGEAFFEVAKNPDHPFVVDAGPATIRVLGTSFEVNQTGETTWIVVSEGKVEVNRKAGNDRIAIGPGTQVAVTGQEITKVMDAHPNFLSWKTGEFNFDSVSLIEAVRDLNTFYRNRISLDTTNLPPCAIHARFSQSSIDEIMETLELTCGCRAEKTETGYILRRKGKKDRI